MREAACILREDDLISVGDADDDRRHDTRIDDASALRAADRTLDLSELRPGTAAATETVLMIPVAELQCRAVDELAPLRTGQGLAQIMQGRPRIARKAQLDLRQEEVIILVHREQIDQMTRLDRDVSLRLHLLKGREGEARRIQHTQ